MGLEHRPLDRSHFPSTDTRAVRCHRLDGRNRCRWDDRAILHGSVMPALDLVQKFLEHLPYPRKPLRPSAFGRADA